EVPTLNLGWSGVAQRIDFTRLGAEGQAMAPVRSGGPPFSVPEIGFVTPLREDLVLAIGFTSPLSGTSGYPADGPQRYSVIDSSVTQGWAGPSIAWRPVRQIALGFGLSWTFLALEQRLALTTHGRDDPAFDVDTAVRARDLSRLGAQLGLIVEPIEEL